MGRTTFKNFLEGGELFDKDRWKICLGDHTYEGDNGRKKPGRTSPSEDRTLEGKKTGRGEGRPGRKKLHKKLEGKDHGKKNRHFFSI